MGAAGRILAGKSATLQAGRDLSFQGGQLASSGDASLTAGNNLTLGIINKTSQVALTGKGGQGEFASVEQKGSELQAGGDLSISANNDLKVTGSGAQAGQALTAVAGGAMTINAGQDLRRTSIQLADGDGGSTGDWEKTTVNGSSLAAGTDLSLAAGLNRQADLTIKASSLVSNSGTASLGASGDITIGTEQQQSRQEIHTWGESSGFLSGSSHDVKQSDANTESLGSLVSANRVAIATGQNVTVSGSNIVGTQDVTMTAGKTLSIEAAKNTYQTSLESSKDESGLFTGGGIAITLGSKGQSQTADTEGTTHRGSTVGSVQGNVTLTAGEAYRQMGSSVEAPAGDVTVTAPKIDIGAVMDTDKQSQSLEMKQGGFTFSITSPAISLIQTAQQMSDASGKTSDPRMKALAAASTALAGKNAWDATKQGTELTGGFDLSLSLGSSNSKSESTRESEMAMGSSLKAGHDLNLIATAGDLTAIGSTLKAGNDANLSAKGNVNLLASANTSKTESKDSSGSASIGIGYNNVNGLYVSLGASRSEDKATGDGTFYTATTLDAGNKASLTSGLDSNLIGGVVTAKQVTADVGRDLNIETTQDKSRYDEKGSSAGFSLRIGTGMWSASASVGSTDIHSSFISANTQAGIQAGDGGFQVNVKGNTDLKGGVIASTDKAIADNKNSLTTGTLTTSDLENKANYDASTVNVGVSFKHDESPTARATQDSTVKGWNAGLPVVLSASGEASGTTRSAVSIGTVRITDEAKQKMLTGKDADQTVADLNRDTKNANGTIKPIFNLDEIKADFQIAQTFVQQMGTFIDNRAKESDAKKTKAEELEKQAGQLAPDDPNQQALLNQAQGLRTDAQAIADQWGPGGTSRRLATALTGAISGDVTGSGNAFIQSAAVNYLQSLTVEQVKGIADSFKENGQITNQSEAVRTALQGLVACAGAAAQNQSCGSAATGAAASVVLNNLISSLADMSPDTMTSQQKEAQRSLVTNLVAGIAQAGGGNAATATYAAVIETENNALIGLVNLLFPPVLPQRKFLGKNSETGAPEEKILTIDKARGKLILIQPSQRQLFASAISEEPVPGYLVITAHASDLTVQTLNSRELAEVIRASGAWDGNTPIMLDACNSGRIEAGVAAQLAKELGVDVIAPTTQTWNLPLGLGAVFQGAYRKIDYFDKLPHPISNINDYIPDLTKPGIWRKFSPNGRITFSEVSPRDNK